MRVIRLSRPPPKRRETQYLEIGPSRIDEANEVVGGVATRPSLLAGECSPKKKRRAARCERGERSFCPLLRFRSGIFVKENQFDT